jgi:hypothetical protein
MQIPVCEDMPFHRSGTMGERVTQQGRSRIIQHGVPLPEPEGNCSQLNATHPRAPIPVARATRVAVMAISMGLSALATR